MAAVFRYHGSMQPWTRDFIELARRQGALTFGRFTLKSGRESPYFFNAGTFNDGASLDRLGRCYASAIVDAGLSIDMLFGPAYKGIPLVAAVAICLSRDHGINLPFAYDRKEAKDHGEGGQLVGADLQGRVLIVDDVISAGTAIAHSRSLIRAVGAEPVAVAVALDRQEVGPEGISAVDAVQQSGMDVVSVARLDDLIDWLGNDAGNAVELEALRAYRSQYGC